MPQYVHSNERLIVFLLLVALSGCMQTVEVLLHRTVSFGHCITPTQEEEQEAAAAKEEAIRKEAKSRKKRAAKANKKTAPLGASSAQARRSDAAKSKAAALT